MRIIACTLLFSMIAAAGQTFNKDVAPIFYSRCVECHRAGEVAPMSLLSYSEARPWAKSIREAVLKHAMPPWLAHPRFGHFSNDRHLSQAEIDTIVAWVDAGAPEGNAEDLPVAPHFEDGWVIGKPDAVIALDQPEDVPAEGVAPYRYIRVHTNFTEDKWVQAAEIRPGNRAVVHHIIVSAVPPGSAGTGEGGEKICGFAPGEQPKIFPPGTAKLLKAGSDLIFQLHYTPNGKPATDKSYVGLIFAKEPVEKRASTGMAVNAMFKIPPGDSNYEARSTFTAKEDIRLVDLMPHMHLRVKDFKYTAVYADGRSEVILDPDPTKEVRWGPQTWEEMMIGWFDYTVESQAVRASR